MESDVKTLGRNKDQNTGADVLKPQTAFGDLNFKIFINQTSDSTTVLEGYLKRTCSMLSEHSLPAPL